MPVIVEQMDVEEIPQAAPGSGARQSAPARSGDNGDERKLFRLMKRRAQRQARWMAD